jgi:uracil phosphoribosyltransferase
MHSATAARAGASTRAPQAAEALAPETSKINATGKTNTPNLHVLPQSGLLRTLHTVIRDRTAAPADFTANSRRIIRLLLDAALDLLPSRPREMVTPVGQTYQGLEPVAAAHPEVAIVTSSVEEGLNENAFMLPGIGDFGDRVFGTETRAAQ